MKKIIYMLIIGIFALNSISATALDKKKKQDTISATSKEVVVTALRYPEQIYEVPMAITPISNVEIQNSIGNGFDNVLNGVPGVMAQMRSGTPDMRITIRGFGSRGAGDRSNSGTTRGIKVILDGIPETEPDGRTSFDNIDMAFVDNMEVIRSNASAIWGNAAGGVISINTMPLTQQPFVKLNALGGSYGFQKYAVSAYNPFENGAMSANFSATKFDGYRQNSAGEKYTANFRFRSLLGANTILNSVITGADNQFGIPGPLTEEQLDNSPEMANATYLKRRERRHNRTLRIGLALDHNFDADNSLFAMVYANPKFLQRSERNTFRDFTRYHIGTNISYKNSLMIGDEIKNIALFGFDEAYQDGAISFYKLVNGGRGSLKESKSEGANSLGAYFQDEILLGESWSFLVGARWDKITYFAENFYNIDNNPRLPLEKKSFDKLTPKAAISFRIAPEHSLYLSMGGGVEVPAGNETNPNNIQDTVQHLQMNMLLDPIISTTYELGTKQLIKFDDGFFNYISYDAALYYIGVKNELVPYSEGAYFMSVGKTERIGVELALETKFLDCLSFNTALTYMSGKYTNYKIDTLYAGFNADYTDNKIAGIPEFYYNVSLKYAPQDFYGLFAEINMQGVSKYFSDDANLYEVPSYGIFNLSFGMNEYLKLTDYLGFRAYVQINNISDVNYAASSFINPSIDETSKQAMYLEPGLPRNFAVGVSFKFD